jgi:type II secretory pathway component PulJ
MQKKIKLNFSFTLVETLLVVSLFSLIGVALLSTFNSGLKVWDRVFRERLEEDVFLFFEKFYRDLRNTFSYQKINFLGEEDKLKFPTLVFTKSDLSGLKEGVGEVKYYWDKEEKKLFRVKRNLSDIYRESLGKKEILLKNVKDFKLSYYFYDQKEKKYFWQKEWHKSGFPLAVRINLLVNDGEREIQFKKTISIPVAN